MCVCNNDVGITESAQVGRLGFVVELSVRGARERVEQRYIERRALRRTKDARENLYPRS